MVSRPVSILNKEAIREQLQAELGITNSLPQGAQQKSDFSNVSDSVVPLVVNGSNVIENNDSTVSSVNQTTAATHLHEHAPICTSTPSPNTAANGDDVNMMNTQVLIQHEVGETFTAENDCSEHVLTDPTQVAQPATIYQTADGVVIVKNSDGTVQLYGVEDHSTISMETVQALLAMDVTQMQVEHVEH